MKGCSRAAALVAAVVLGGLVGAGGAAAATGAGLEGVPRVQHVVVLILENESFASTWSAQSPARYLNSLVHQGAFVPQYYGTGHVSLDNYLAMPSGLAGPQIANTYTDCLGLNLYTCAQEVTVAASSGSIADQLEQAGLTWKEYADGTSAPCVHDSYDPTAAPDTFQGDMATPESSTAGPNYADRHVPFLYYDGIVGNQARCAAHLRPFTELAHDLRGAGLPAYSFITPDTCDDGHDSPCADGRPGGLTSADVFLRATLPSLLAYLQANDGVLLITFDEGSPMDTSGCCHGGPAGQAGFGAQVGLLALGPMVRAGAISTAQYDHASLLRTTEDALGITTHLGNATASTPMDDIWSATTDGVTTPTTPQPAPTAVPSATPPTSLPNTSSAPPQVAAALLLAALTALATITRRHAYRRRSRTASLQTRDR